MAFFGRAREEVRRNSGRDSTSGTSPVAERSSTIGALLSRTNSGGSFGTRASSKSSLSSSPSARETRLGSGPINLLVEDDAIWDIDHVPHRVMAAKFDVLVEIASDDKHASSQDVTRVLLATLHQWSTPLAFIEALAVRARVMSSKLYRGLEESQGIAKRRLLRIVAVCKYWIQQYWIRDFAGEQNNSFSKRFETIVTEDLVPVTVSAGALLTQLQQMRSAKNPDSDNRTITVPPPLITDSEARNKFWAIPAIEVARQLTLREHARLRRIGLLEFSEQYWLKVEKEKRAPGITESIRYFNQFSEWATSEVLLLADLPDRVACLEWLIEVSRELWNLNNFSTALQIVSALGRPPVMRLKDTWKAVSSERMKDHALMTERFSPLGNWKVLREHLSKAKIPVVPYLGVFLTDFVMLEEGNSATTTGKSGDTLVNFDRYRRFTDILSQIESYMSTPYDFMPVSALVAWITKLRILPDSKMYELSELIQPRKQGDGSAEAQTETKVQHTISMLRIILHQQLEHHLPNVRINTFKFRSAPGEVYLWPEDIAVRKVVLQPLNSQQVEYATLPDGALYILFSQLTATKAALATLVRISHAFSKSHLYPMTVKAVMATSEAGDNEMAIAAEHGIDVLVLDTGNRQNPIAFLKTASAPVTSYAQYTRNFAEWPAFLAACGLEPNLASEAGRKLVESGKRVSDAAMLDKNTLESLNLSAAAIHRAIEYSLPLFQVVQSPPPAGKCPFSMAGKKERRLTVQPELLQKPDESSSLGLLQATLVSLEPTA